MADGTAGLLLAAAPVSLVVYGLYGALVQPFAWRPIDLAGGSDWYTFIHVHTGTAALEAVPVAVCLVAVGLLVADPVASAGLRVSKSLLGEPRRNLQRRVEHLSRARGAAIDGEATRLNKIERDLHDGAQARLVAMGMTLSAAERLISTDPLAAQALVVEARDASSRALAELRDLVRGIHPPVLADRGLPDALRALAFDVSNQLVVVEDRDPCPRFSPPVEAALYFAAREAVTNAVKHFKHEQRGKRRLHKTPDAGEVAACRWWLESESRLVRPRVIRAMGGTAVPAVFGRPMPIMKSPGTDHRTRGRGARSHHRSSVLSTAPAR